jgi:hypothetical protein
MGRDRPSIRGLMVLLVLLAAGLAALRTPSRLWANLWFSMSLAALTLAIPAAAYSRGGRRAFWVGFAACGWVYFIIAMAPWFQSEVSFQLITTAGLDILSPYIVQKEYLLHAYIGGLNPPRAPTPPTPWQAWNLPEFPQETPWHLGYATLHSPGLYLRIGHAACCLLIACCGGEIIRYLHATRSESRAAER